MLRNVGSTKLLTDVAATDATIVMNALELDIALDLVGAMAIQDVELSLKLISQYL